MIYVYCDNEAIRNSIYHILKAFFPQAEVKSGASPCNDSFLKVEDENGIIYEVKDAADKYSIEVGLYDLLKERCGRSLPWGGLTGVRPVKLASAMLGQMSAGEYAEYIEKTRRVSPQKALLSYNIAAREQNIIRNTLGVGRNTHSYSIYVGIPICPSKCTYCSFSSGTLGVWKDKLDAYLDALEGEMGAVSGCLKSLSPTSIYIGGGTPTVLNERQLDRLFGIINKYFNVTDAAEYTLEAGRADTITREKLEIALSCGVDRISVNPQSMQQKTLDRIGRRHTVRQVYDAYKSARDAGFKNINMDLIMGLPGESTDDFDDTLRQVRSLAPDSLTVHSLAIKRAAEMTAQSTDSDMIDAMTELAAQSADDMGLFPYYLYRQKSIAGNHENIGYAAPGCESVYNIMIMEEVQSILAFGAGSTTKILLDEKVQNPNRAAGIMTSMIRQENVKSIEHYLQRYGEMAEKKAEIAGHLMR